MEDLFNELKRRNVVRVGIAYAVIGWILAQVAELVLPTFGAPDWVLKTLMFFLILGLPVALFFSWAYEVTPQGVKKTAEVDADASITPSTGRKLDRVIIISLVVALGYFLWERQGMVEQIETTSVGSELAAPSLASIAVLPFTDLSPGGDQEYFADGLSEEILNVLVGVDALSVASRTSSFQFKGGEASLPEIATALGVTYVLEGSVRKAGSAIRVTGQLIEANSDRHLWSGTFDRELTTENIFAIQDEIAKAIVGALSEELELTTLTAPMNVKSTTTDLSAYDTFLRGRDVFHRRAKVSDVALSIDTLESAVAMDPEFAEAWMWLGAAYGVATGWGLHFIVDDRDFPALSVHAAEQALEIDPDLAFAYGVLGLATLARRGSDYVRAMEMIERGLALEPKNATMVHWKGITLRELGFVEDAAVFFDRCIELDPAFINCRIHAGRNHFYLGEYAEAVADWGAISAEMIPVDGLGLRYAYALVAQGQIFGARVVASYAMASDPTFPASSWIYVIGNSPGRDNEKSRRVETWLDDWMIEQEDVKAGLTSEDIVFLYLSIGAYEKVPTQNLTLGLGGYKGVWKKAFSSYRQTANFKEMVRVMNYLPYWQARGFPPGCRAVGAEDFECG